MYVWVWYVLKMFMFMTVICQSTSHIFRNIYMFPYTEALGLHKNNKKCDFTFDTHKTEKFVSYNSYSKTFSRSRPRFWKT